MARFTRNAPLPWVIGAIICQISRVFAGHLTAFWHFRDRHRARYTANPVNRASRRSRFHRCCVICDPAFNLTLRFGQVSIKKNTVCRAQACKWYAKHLFLRALICTDGNCRFSVTVVSIAAQSHVS
jgi:hypothetical protein